MDEDSINSGSHLEWRHPGTPLTAEQSEHRKLVLKQITAAPGAFDMNSWEHAPAEWEALLAQANGDGYCGTTRCIAGWSQYMVRGYVKQATVQQDAVNAMGLTWKEYREGGSVAVGLFHTTNDDAVDRLSKLAEVEPG
jgi:hypothetical protein